MAAAHVQSGGGQGSSSRTAMRMANR